MTHMRILLAAALYPPEGGGPATYAKALTDSLSQEGVEVSLVTFSEVRKFPVGIRHLVYFFLLLRRSRGCTVVYAMDPVSVGVPALCASFVLRKPLVVKVVGDYAWEQGRQRFGATHTLDEFVRTKQTSWIVRVLQWVEYRVATYATRVVVPSEYLKKIVGRWGIPAQKISVIYNAGPELGSMGNKNVLRGILKYHDKFIVSVGRLVPWKNMEGIIRAVEGLAKSGITPKLLIIGSGPQEGALTALVSEKGMEEQVTFTGQLPNDITLAYIKAADVFVLNSGYEGFSHLLLEALALGTPTVATKVGGNPELITHGVSGLLVPYADDVALTGALQKMLTDEKFRKNVSAAGKRAAGKFTRERMLKETAGLLRSVGT